MTPDSSTPEDRFAAVVAALRDRPGVTSPSDSPQPAKRFGATALKAEDKIFAMLVGGTLVVKLPRPRVDALVANGDGDRFVGGNGHPMKEWLALCPTADQDWLALATEAFDFVAPTR